MGGVVQFSIADVLASGTGERGRELVRQAPARGDETLQSLFSRNKNSNMSTNRKNNRFSNSSSVYCKLYLLYTYDKVQVAVDLSVLNMNKIQSPPYFHRYHSLPSVLLREVLIARCL